MGNTPGICNVFEDGADETISTTLKKNRPKVMKNPVFEVEGSVTPSSHHLISSRYSVQPKPIPRKFKGSRSPSNKSYHSGVSTPAKLEIGPKILRANKFQLSTPIEKVSLRSRSNSLKGEMRGFNNLRSSFITTSAASPQKSGMRPL